MKNVRVHAFKLLIGFFATFFLLAQSLAGVASHVHAQPSEEPSQDSGDSQQSGGSDLGSAKPLPEQFSACAAAGGNIDVLILVDESGSLVDSDPNNARVTSGLHLVSRMSKLTKSGNLSVAVSGFGHEYSTVRDWQEVKNDSDVESLRGAINDLSNRTNGIDTDYWTAMDEARKQLANRAHERGSDAKSCQAIIWFSDGELDYEVRKGNMASKYGETKPFAPDISLKSEDGAKKVEEKAREDICRSGGLADQLRSSRVAMFGVGLGSKDGKEFDLMRSIATGKDSGGKSCGDLTDPVPGEFYLASDIDSLLIAFDSISGLGQKPITNDHGVCVKDFCQNEAHTFVLDNTTLDVDGFATATADGLRAALQGPDGKIVDLKKDAKNEKAEVSGVPLTYSWETGRSLSFRLDGTSKGKIGDKGPWVGVWRLAFIADEGADSQAKSKSNLHITPGIVPAWPDKDNADVRAGSTLNDVTFALHDRKGNDVPVDSITSTGKFTATFTDSAGKQSTLTDTSTFGDITKPINWDLRNAPTGGGTLNLSLELTTASAKDSDGKEVKGTKLSPATVALPITVQPPLDYPTVPTKVDFGEAKGKIDLNSVLKLGGKGCAWVEPDSTEVIASPAGLDKVQVSSDASSKDSCVKAGEDLGLTLASDQQGNGAINGTFVVMSASENGQGEPVKTKVEFTASAVKPLNTLNFVTTLIIALLLGPGIPLLILYFVKWRGAKIPSQPLVAVRAQIEKTSTGVTRDGSRFAFNQGDMRNTVMIDSGGSRQIDAAGVTLKTKMGGSPLGPGFVVAEVPMSVSKHDPARRPARLPLAVHNHWLVMRSEGMNENQAEILVLLAGNIDEKQREKMEDEIAREAGDLMDRLPSTGAQAPAGHDSPFGGPSEPQSNPFAEADAPSPAPSSPFGGPGPTGPGSAPQGQPPAGPPPAGPGSQPPAGPGAQPPAGPGAPPAGPGFPGAGPSGPDGSSGNAPGGPGSGPAFPGPGGGPGAPGPDTSGPGAPGQPPNNPFQNGPGQPGPGHSGPGQSGPGHPGQNPFSFGQ